MKRLLIALVPAVVLAGLIGWRLNKNGEAAAAQTKVREMRSKTAPMVSVAAARTEDIDHKFEAMGSIEAPFNLKLAPKVTGRIEYLQVREGDHVSVGQELVRIDPTEVEAEVRSKSAALAEAKHRLAQAQLTQNSVTVGVGTQIEEKKAAVETAKVLLKQAQQNYDNLVASSRANIEDTEGRVRNADAAIANADAAIRSAQANLENARAHFRRKDDLAKQGAISKQDADDAETDMNVRSSAVEVAKGQKNAAIAARDSAAAQRKAAVEQSAIGKRKGQSDIDVAKANLDQAEATLRNAQANTSQTPAYQANVDALRSAMVAAEADLHSAQSRRADTVLRSTIDGYVTARYMDPGATATAGQAIVAVQSVRQVWANVTIPEEEARRVFVGQHATVSLDALPGATFSGKVIHLNPSADMSSRQFTAHIALENTQNRLKPGMFARALLLTERVANAIVVPREAIQQGKNGAEVVVVGEDLKAQHKSVVLGATDTSVIQVKKGLKPGDKVITLSAIPIRDGQTVKVGKPG